MGFGLEGRLVRLVPIDLDRHEENYFRWVNDPEVSQNLMVEYPITRLAERGFLESVSGMGGTDVVFPIELLDGAHIGTSGIHRIDHVQKSAVTGSFIGEAQYRGKGYGTEAAILRAHYCFYRLGLRQVYSSFIGTNEASLAMQRKVGYEIYGVRPAALWKCGEWQDETLTVLTRDRFYGLHKPFTDSLTA